MRDAAPGGRCRRRLAPRHTGKTRLKGGQGCICHTLPTQYGGACPPSGTDRWMVALQKTTATHTVAHVPRGGVSTGHPPQAQRPMYEPWAQVYQSLKPHLNNTLAMLAPSSGVGHPRAVRCTVWLQPFGGSMASNWPGTGTPQSINGMRTVTEAVKTRVHHVALRSGDLHSRTSCESGTVSMLAPALGSIPSTPWGARRRGMLKLSTSCGYLGSYPRNRFPFVN